MDAEVVGSPVDEGVGLCEPGFAEEKVVILQRVDKGIEGSGVLLSSEGNVSSVGREGARAVWKDDGDGGRRVERELMSLYKRGADDVALSSTVDEDPSGVAINIADKGKEGGLGLLGGEGRHTNAPFSQPAEFALGHCGKDRHGLRYGRNGRNRRTRRGG